jgi:hypothetical protein
MTLGQSWRLGLLAVMAAGLVSASPVAARTWRVMRDGSGDYTTIQPAVDGASPGDTILIGPGRYLEHTPFWPGLPAAQEKSWPKETFVAVRVDSLTIRGVSRDQVIIGPEQPNYTIQGPLGIVNLAVGTSLTIRDLQVENLFNGCYLFGKILIDNCTFRACDQGVAYWASDGMLVSGCDFYSSQYGVVAFPGAANPVITGCRFVGNDGGVDFSNTQNGLVTDCTFEDNLVGVQFEQGTTGTIRNCRIDSQNACVSIVAPSVALIVDNYCQGHKWYSAVLSGDVTATGNVFVGGDAITIVLQTEAARFHGNHILKGSGWAIKAEGPIEPPLRYSDFTNNYWGTSSADSIRAWIWDHLDDPYLYAQVNFEPFSPTPLPTEKKSLGGVKSLYR